MVKAEKINKKLLKLFFICFGTVLNFNLRTILKPIVLEKMYTVIILKLTQAFVMKFPQLQSNQKQKLAIIAK